MTLSLGSKKIELKEHEIFMLFRWLLVLLILFMIGYSKVGLTRLHWGYVLILIYFGINISLRVFLPKLYGNEAFIFALALMDIIFVSVAIYIAEVFRSELYLLYFLTILMPSLGGSLRSSIPAAIVSSTLYIWLMSKHDGISWTEPGSLLKIPFFFLVAFFTGFWADTVRRRAKEREVEAERVLSNLSSGVVVVERDGRIKFINDVAREILGLHLPPGTLSDLPSPFKKILEDGFSGKIYQRHEFDFEGKKIGLSTSLIAMDDEIKGVIAIFKDITEMERMKREMERAKRLGLLGEVALWIAHEIRNPLAVVQGMAQLIEMVDTCGDVKKYAAEIVKNARRIEGIIEDILEFHRDDVMKKEEFNLLELAQEVGEDMRIKFGDRVKVRGEDVEVMGDREKIRRVIVNLATNAIEASPDDEEVKIEVGRKGDFAEIKVVDRGDGIPEEIKQHIFEPFFTTKSHGSGLGLPIVHRIVEKHGGSITFESSPGEGTTFYVKLPIKGGKDEGTHS
ncbi:hypothetical protein DRQ18_06165 [bacterium]|nr:MAG: hypothetical protein DRQ18_06165 [bacterium]